MLHLKLEPKLLSVWIERHNTEGCWIEGRPDTKAQKILANFLTLLEKDFRQTHSVTDYADAMGITTTHLTRQGYRMKKSFAVASFTVS